MSRGLLAWMQPRDPGVAAKVVSTLAAVGLVVTLAFLPLVREDVDRSSLELAVVVVIAVTCVALVGGARWMARASTRTALARCAWAVCPFLAIALIVTVDLATFDASLAAQVFFLFPALYAGTLLPRRGAVLVAATLLAGEAVVVTTNLSAREAAIDLGYMAAAILATVFVLVQSTEREAALRRELQRTASTDALTGLVNRRAFDTLTAASLDGATEPGTALVLLDIDGFKALNDRYGHPGGDDVLVQLAALLSGLARAGDAVCRLGGDEIAVLMPDCTVDVARRRAQDMVEAVRGHGFAIGVQQVDDVTISAGLAHYPTDAASVASLYEAADLALYDAKRDGRDRLSSREPRVR